MVHLISVTPLGDGWAVKSDGVAGDMIFRSGSQAERAARRLGERLASVGTTSEIQIYIRGDALIARFVCGPPSVTR